MSLLVDLFDDAIARYAAEFDPAKHPRGQPENSGEFAESQASNSSDKENIEASSLKKWVGDSKVVNPDGSPREIDGFYVKHSKNLPTEPSSRLMKPWKLGQEIGRACEQAGFETHYNTGVAKARHRIKAVLDNAGRSDLIEQWDKLSGDHGFGLEREVGFAFNDGMRSTDESWAIPEYKLAWRYSAPPQDGYSFNYRDQTRELGVSVVAFLDEASSERKQNLDKWYAVGGEREKYYVGGWYFGAHGSDGEPVLNEVAILDKGEEPTKIRHVDDFGTAQYAAVDAPLRRSIAQAESETDTNPTHFEAEAGNYRKGRFIWNGLQIVIENPAGSVRNGCSADGHCWQKKMPWSYGYLSAHAHRKTQISHSDLDNLDCFLGPDPESELIFVVDQVKPDGAHDEHKLMIGWNSEAEAREAYLSSYHAGWKGLKAITAMTLPEFRDWLEDGDTRRPVAQYALACMFDEAVARYATFDPEKHPRGQPENKGEFRQMDDDRGYRDEDEEHEMPQHPKLTPGEQSAEAAIETRDRIERLVKSQGDFRPEGCEVSADERVWSRSGGTHQVFVRGGSVIFLDYTQGQQRWHELVDPPLAHEVKKLKASDKLAIPQAAQSQVTIPAAATHAAVKSTPAHAVHSPGNPAETVDQKAKTQAEKIFPVLVSKLSTESKFKVHELIGATCRKNGSLFAKHLTELILADERLKPIVQIMSPAQREGRF